MKKLPPFDRYAYYHRAVQSTEPDCQFVSDTYKELRGKRPLVLREDFCGTFALSCEWIRRSREHRAYGIDLDVEPLDYGRTHYFTKLRDHQQKRLQLFQASVLTAKVPAVDVVLAMNFSYYLFKSRKLLKKYFKNAFRGLRRNGLFVADCFGGSESQLVNVDCSKIGNFNYYWDQTSFDPVTHYALFHIHFKRKGEKKRERVFTYDWRLWTIPEIREVMLEAGFRRTHVYWEGTTRSGEGDGKYKRTEEGEDCQGWVAYVVGEK